jgi:uridine kinase
LPIRSQEVLKEEAIPILPLSTARLLRWLPRHRITIYGCDDSWGYFPVPLLSRTGQAAGFELMPYPPGFLLRFPDDSGKLPKFRKMPKLFSVFQEAEHWAEILEVEDVGHLNEQLIQNQGPELMKIAEALHEKRVAQLADRIASLKIRPRLVLIAGPSASGKSTLARRLYLQLRVLGLKPLVLSTDDYFKDRVELKDPVRFESLDALDLGLFNQQLNELLGGKEVELPKFDFSSGRGLSSRKRVRLGPDDPLICEGLHALNDELTSGIPAHLKFKLYASALTQLNLDDYNRISTADTRLLRRLIRDHRFRGYPAEETLSRWPRVREGEEANIFPFQEAADEIFNSSLIYELSVLKSLAEPLLAKIPPTSAQYPEAQRLRSFLDHFLPLSSFGIPPTSIIREFIGGSSFGY